MDYFSDKALATKQSLVNFLDWDEDELAKMILSATAALAVRLAVRWAEDSWFPPRSES